jgi:hypothetical protein
MRLDTHCGKIRKKKVDLGFNISDDVNLDLYKLKKKRSILIVKLKIDHQLIYY